MRRTLSTTSYRQGDIVPVSLLATKADLRAEIAGVKAEIASLKADLTIIKYFFQPVILLLLLKFAFF